MNVYDVYYENPEMDNYIAALETYKEYLDLIIPSSNIITEDEYDEAFESLTGYRDEDLTDEEFEYVLESIFGPDLSDSELAYYAAEEGIFKNIGDKIGKLGSKVSDNFNKKQKERSEELRKKANLAQDLKNDSVTNAAKYNRRIEQSFRDAAAAGRKGALPKQYSTEVELKERSNEMQEAVNKANKKAIDAEEKYKAGSKVGNFLNKLSMKANRADKKVGEIRRSITHMTEEEENKREAEREAKRAERKAEREKAMMKKKKFVEDQIGKTAWGKKQAQKKRKADEEAKKAEKELKEAKRKEEDARKRIIKTIAKNTYKDNVNTMNMTFNKGGHIYKPGEVSIKGTGSNGVRNMGRTIPPKTLEAMKNSKSMPVDGGYHAPNQKMINNYVRSQVADMDKKVKSKTDKLFGDDAYKSRKRTEMYKSYAGA